MRGISGGLSNGEQPIEIVLALSGRIRHGYTGSGQSNRKGDGDGEHATRGGRHEIPNATQKVHGPLEGGERELRGGVEHWI